MRWTRLVIAATIFIGPVSHSPAAEPYLQEELRVPFALAGPRGLEALLVRPNEPGRYPLALITHGAPRSIDQHASMSPLAMLPQAIEFARRGWAAVVVMRRGYGDSGGDWADGYGYCGNPNYIAAATAGAADLKAAITFLVRRPDIDPSRVIGVGVSAGGFATVALTADPPRSLSPPSALPAAADRCTTTARFATRTGSSKLLACSAGGRGYPCFGSMPKTTTTSGQNWRSN